MLDEVMKFLRGVPHASYQEMQEALGLSETQLWEALYNLRREGRVEIRAKFTDPKTREEITQWRVAH